MVALKNVEGIIDAFYTLTQNIQQEVQLIFAGNRNDTYSLYADKLGLLGRQVFFRGEVPYTEVAQCMQQSHCFILNSTIENSPCTISEALCCGLLVITTAVGGTPEMVNETNGLLVPASNAAALTAAMQQAMENFNTYNRTQIAAAASEKYGQASIAEKFRDLYATL
jgi:glycosyltransferase involved in cell wall biosynthesis